MKIWMKEWKHVWMNDWVNIGQNYGYNKNMTYIMKYMNKSNEWKNQLKNEQKKNGMNKCNHQNSLPNIKLQMAVLAIFMFWNEPRMWIFVSASTILVLVTFSMVNLVFPPLPAILPMALDKWSPFRGLTSVTSKDSKNSSSSLNSASASWRRNRKNRIVVNEMGKNVLE